jgi:HD superfamily phosphohydrolase
VWAVEGLLLARHHMHRQVYGHKTRVATDIMLERALAYGVDDGALEEGAYQIPVADGQPAPDEAFLAAYLRQTDEHVLQRLLAQDGRTRSRDLAERLCARRLLRRGARIPLHERQEELGVRLRTILGLGRTRISELEQQLAEQLGHPPHLVGLRIERPSNPTYRLPGAEINPQDIMLSYEGRPPNVFEHESEIFRQEAGEEKSFASLYHPKDDQIDETRATELLWSTLTNL